MYIMIYNTFIFLLLCNLMVDGGLLPDEDDINKDIEKELKEHIHDFGE